MKLSPAITPAKYDRIEGQGVGDAVIVEYDYYGIVPINAREFPPATVTSEGDVVFYDDDLTLFVTGDSTHVTESRYRSTQMVVLREMVLEGLRKLADAGVVLELEPSDRRAGASGVSVDL